MLSIGYSLACDGGLVAVGSPGESSQGVSSGAVYLFMASTSSVHVWIQRGKYTSDCTVYNNHDNEANTTSVCDGESFGVSVSIGGGWLIVGADTATGIEQGTGSIFVSEIKTESLSNGDSVFSQRY